jgi:glycosyltransferase involved in cell wall biosynthesis
VTFSILLPTRNRLEYLRYAIESVRRQDESDWEIVVSDNCSADDVGGYVASLNDTRIRFFQTSEFVAVTENWNNALAQSRGDYLVMLGDDDALMPGYFRTVRELVERFDEPDLVYTGALLFAYPEVLKESPRGFLQAYGYAAFLRGHRHPYVLDPAEARALPREALNFRIRMGFNAQFAAVSRRLIERLRNRGPFYQSPFPDYFSMNASFLTADKIVVCPLPLVLIGMTKKSYGYFHHSGQDGAAMRFLNNSVDPETAARLEGVVLPGSNINNGWLFAMEALQAEYGGEFGLRVNHRRYRHVQIMNTFRDRYLNGTASDDDVVELKRALSLPERIGYGAIEHFAYREGRPIAAVIKGLVFKAWRLFGRHFSGGPTTYLPWFAEKIEGRYANALEVFEQVDPSDPAWLS